MRFSDGIIKTEEDHSSEDEKEKESKNRELLKLKGENESLKREIGTIRVEYNRKMNRLEKQTRSAYAEIESMKKGRFSESEYKNEIVWPAGSLEELENALIEKDNTIKQMEESLFEAKISWADENNLLRVELERAEQNAIDAKMKYVNLASQTHNVIKKLDKAASSEDSNSKSQPTLQKKKWTFFKKKQKK